MIDLELYIEKSKAFVDFMLLQQQWSGLTKADVDAWLNNFSSQSTEKKALTYRLLTNIIYFSENDVVNALREGVFRCLSYEAILKEQKDNDFSLSSHSLIKLYEEVVAHACFVPLLDSNSPHESGNTMSRALVQQGIVAPDQSVFIEKAPVLLKSGKYKHLVIVDDCVGSGDQLDKFWNNTVLDVEGSNLSIAEMCSKYSVTAHYLTLFGYDVSINTMKTKYKGLNIHCVRKLYEEHRVFSDSSYVWENPAQRDEAYAYLEEMANEVGIPIRGYKNLDFAFVMHKTIPDWSLPIFWKETADWNILLRRKNSNE